MDGLPNIVRSERRLVKFIWAVLLLLNCCVCIFLIIGTIREYLNYEVISTSRILQEEESIFPTITICNNNPFSTDYSVQLIKQANLSFSTNPRRLILQLESYFKITTGSYMPDSIKRKLSDLDSMLIGCWLNNLECNSSHFEWIWHPYFFGCYRFNSGFDSKGLKTDLRESSMAGQTFRFVLYLYAGLPNEFSPYASRKSFNLFIQNASDYPFSTKPSPFILTTITGTTISVKRSFFSQFNEWPFSYSECRVNENNELIGEPLADPYLFEQVVASNYSYTRDTCIHFCAQLMSTKVCKCNYYFWPLRVDDFDICLTSEQTACATDFYYNTFIVGDFIKNNCFDKCPIECNIRTFTTSQSYFQYPTCDQAANLFYDSKFMSAHANQTDASGFNLNFMEYSLAHPDHIDAFIFLSLYYKMISASVFYESLSYSMTEERPAIVMTELIGSIGGHLHLFLGMSLLSFIEIIELGAFFIISKTKSKNDNLATFNTNAENQKVKALKKRVKLLRMDGLPNIVKSKNALFKLVWVTIFATSFSICVCLIVGSVTDYLDYDVSNITFSLNIQFNSNNY